MTYNTEKATSIADIGNTFQNVITLTTPNLETGLYEVKFSLQYTFTTTSKYLEVRWRVDGGAYTVLREQARFTSIPEVIDYFYPKNYAQGVHTLELEMRKEDATGTLNVEFADLIFQRVGI